MSLYFLLTVVVEVREFARDNVLCVLMYGGDDSDTIRGLNTIF